jgi:hypothetical protein
MSCRQPKSPTNFDNVSKNEGSKKPMQKLLTHDEVKKQNKKKFNLYEHFLAMVENNTTIL